MHGPLSLRLGVVGHDLCKVAGSANREEAAGKVDAVAGEGADRTTCKVCFTASFVEGGGQCDVRVS